jgi:hypothetical protein
MRLGVFLDSQKWTDQAIEVCKVTSEKFVGYSAKYQNPSLTDVMPFVANPIELVAGCDAVILFGENIEIAKAALKRGIHVFFASLPQTTKYSLVEIKNLLQEIDVNVGFGFAGIDLIEETPIEQFPKPLFIDFTRNLPQNSDLSEIEWHLKFDICTLIKIDGCNIRKIRTTCHPLESNDYKLLNLRIELSNGSVFCYTTNRLAEEHSWKLKIYGNGLQDMEKANGNIPAHSNLSAGLIIPFNGFVDNIKKKQTVGFDIDKAIDSFRVIEEIKEKLSIYSQ